MKASESQALPDRYAHPQALIDVVLRAELAVANRKLAETREALRPFVENGNGPDRKSRGFRWTAGQHVVWLTRDEWDAALAALAVADEAKRTGRILHRDPADDSGYVDPWRNE